jgi:hypothetical protein
VGRDGNGGDNDYILHSLGTFGIVDRTQAPSCANDLSDGARCTTETMTVQWKKFSVVGRPLGCTHDRAFFCSRPPASVCEGALDVGLQ